MEALTNQVLTLFQTHLPNTPRYTKCLPSVSDAQAIARGVTLEDLINAGVTILFEAPDVLPAWHQAAKLLIA